MYLQVMLLTGLTAQTVAAHYPPAYPTVARATFGIPDTLFLFVIALVIFGPKRLPEIGKQIGKLVFEFRRASNDFKLQIEEELRVAEQQDKQKQIEAQSAAKPVTTAAESSTAPAETASDGTAPAPPPPDRSTGQDAAPIVQPPSTGKPVSALPPNHAAFSGEPAPPTVAPEIETPAPEPAAAPEPTTAHNG